VFVYCCWEGADIAGRIKNNCYAANTKLTSPSASLPAGKSFTCKYPIKPVKTSNSKYSSSSLRLWRRIPSPLGTSRNCKPEILVDIFVIFSNLIFSSRARVSDPDLKKNAEISSARRRIICLLELEVNNAIR
jgi:hypothetical protein